MILSRSMALTFRRRPKSVQFFLKDQKRRCFSKSFLFALDLALKPPNNLVLELLELLAGRIGKTDHSRASKQPCGKGKSQDGGCMIQLNRCIIHHTDCIIQHCLLWR